MRKPKRVLEPVEKISEFLFGLIMVLTLTCTFSVDGANRGSVRTLLVEALGCNVAWGTIDAFFYLLNSLGQRGHGVALLKQLRRTSEPGEARRMVADALPPFMASLLEPQEIESLKGKLIQIPESTVCLDLLKRTGLEHWGCFCWYFCHFFLWWSHSFSSATPGWPFVFRMWLLSRCCF
jgi:hypothetical protein